MHRILAFRSLNGELTKEGLRRRIDDFRTAGIGGFFTDEPQLSGRGYPVYDGLFSDFEARYGYFLRERLFDLTEDGACTHRRKSVAHCRIYAEPQSFRSASLFPSGKRVCRPVRLCGKARLERQVKRRGSFCLCAGEYLCTAYVRGQRRTFRVRHAVRGAFIIRKPAQIPEYAVFARVFLC